MKRAELLTRLLAAAFLLAVIAVPLVFWARTPLIHASMAENGGWSPDTLQARVGEPLHLKFTSDDVMHGFAVGQMEMAPLDIEPGKVSEISLTFDRPGIYTFFCTRWCGLNHWRMRGTIEVSGETTATEPGAPPLYVTLGLDIDAPHPADSVPASPPSALRGQELLDQFAGFPASRTSGYYRSTSPTRAFADLSPSPLTETQRWELVAALWRSNTSPAGLAEGQALYARNCAACHGESGAGDGVFASQLARAGAASQMEMTGAQQMSMQKPVDFSAPDLLGASPALLHGKILRGGMGTGMPMWGSIFTDEQIWNVTAYLYSFQFDYSQ